MDEIACICNKLPKLRTESDLRTLMQHIRNMTIFDKLARSQGETVLMQCCSLLCYEEYREGEFIFREGDAATKFYLIIKGRVAVQKTWINKETGEGYTREMIELRGGCGFGEIALEKNLGRTASIYCKTDSSLFTLNKDDYTRLVSKLVKEQRDKIVTFLKSLPIFESVTYGTLAYLTYTFREEIYTKGQIVYSEGTIGKLIYFVFTGEFGVSKSVKSKESARVPYKKPLSSFPKQRLLLLMGKGEYFGEIEVLEGVPRMYTCVCKSDGIVFTIHKDVRNIQDLCKRINSVNFIRALKIRGKNKQEGFQHRLNFWEKFQSESLDLVQAPEHSFKLKSSRLPEKPCRKSLLEVTSKTALKRFLPTIQFRKNRAFSKTLSTRRSTKLLPRTAIEYTPEQRKRVSKSVKALTISAVSMNSLPIYEALWKTPRYKVLNR